MADSIQNKMHIDRSITKSIKINALKARKRPSEYVAQPEPSKQAHVQFYESEPSTSTGITHTRQHIIPETQEKFCQPEPSTSTAGIIVLVSTLFPRHSHNSFLKKLTYKNLPKTLLLIWHT